MWRSGRSRSASCFTTSAWSLDRLDATDMTSTEGLPTEGCDYVSRYLERWLDEGERSQLDLDAVGAHATECPRCCTRLAHFFRSVDLPESSYLKETIDELAWSLLNLARAVMRDRPVSDDSDKETAVLAITREGGGSAGENVEAGQEMIDDAEDYVGSATVGGMDLEEVRGLLEDAEQAHGLRVELALSLFQRVTELESRYEAEAWNWIGALEYRRERLDAAEAAFLKVLSLKEGLEEVRSFAHCTLAYIFKHRGDLDRAVKSARRSVVLAEEDGKDPYFGRFAELYLRLLRASEGDAVATREILTALRSSDWDRFGSDITAVANAPVLAVYRQSGLAEEFPVGS